MVKNVKEMLNILNQIKKKVQYTVSKNLKKAIHNIYTDIKKDGILKSTILLSPAAASFDQFRNFENRGNYFKNLAVKKFEKVSDVKF